MNVHTNAAELATAFPKAIELSADIRKFHEWFEQNGAVIGNGLFPLPHDDADITWHSGGKRTLGRLGVILCEDDGSRYCVWQSDDGRQPIVFLPAAGGEACVLAENAIDFFRLVAVGYEDIWLEQYRGGNFGEPETDTWVNHDFREWVTETFEVTIPQTGNAIVRKAQAAYLNSPTPQIDL